MTAKQLLAKLRKDAQEDSSLEVLHAEAMLENLSKTAMNKSQKDNLVELIRLAVNVCDGDQDAIDALEEFLR